MKVRYCLMFLLLTGFAMTASNCKKSPIDQLTLLPPATNTGANIFGCLIEGRAELPRDDITSLLNPYAFSGVRIVDRSNDIVEFDIHNGRDRNPLVFQMVIRFANYSKLSIGDYYWKQSTFGLESFPYYFNHVYGSFYNDSTNSLGSFGSYDNSGIISITNVDTIRHIISGLFNGKLREQNGTREISITNGRFDFGPDLYKTKFP